MATTRVLASVAPLLVMLDRPFDGDELVRRVVLPQRVRVVVRTWANGYVDALLSSTRSRHCPTAHMHSPPVAAAPASTPPKAVGEPPGPPACTTTLSPPPGPVVDDM